jgi:predicted dehydrogenase
VNLGLVGPGAWGRRYLETIARRQDCRVVAVARASDQTGGGWQGLVSRARRGELDGLIVATTPQNQAEVVEAAAGEVPVLVEKPLGLSAQVPAALLAMLRSVARPAPVIVDFIHLWAPAYGALKALASGPLTAIASEGCSRGPYRPWSSLHDYGPHDAALCLDLAGPVKSFRVRSVRRLPGPDGQGELFQVELQLGELPVAITTGNGASSKRRRLTVTLAAGRTLVYDDLQEHPFKLRDGEREVPVSRTTPLDAVLTAFLEQIAAWKATCLDPGAAVATVALAARAAVVLDAIAAGDTASHPL